MTSAPQSMRPTRVHAGLYRAGPYLISMVRRGYWDIWRGDEPVDIDGWSAWPSLASARAALERFVREGSPPDRPSP